MWLNLKLQQLAFEKGAIKIGPFGSQLKKTELVSSGVHVIGIENVLSGRFDGLGDRYINEAKFRALRSFEVKPGDVLITMMGTIGEVAVVPTNISPSIMDSHLLRIRVERGLCSPEYLSWLIKGSTTTKRAIHGNAQGAIMKGLNSKIVRNLPTPIPPLSEQHRIVKILDQADELRKKRVEAEAKAALIIPALFYKMFGDPATNPKRWDIKPLTDFEAQVRYGLGQPPKASTTGVALIRATNISRGTIIPKNMIYVEPQDVPPGRNAFLKEDEVLVVRSGAYTGDIAQVTKKWAGCVAGYDLVISPGKYLTGEFVEAYLLMPFIQKGYFYNLKARAGQPHLNAAQVSATPFLDVPIDLQVQFSEAVQSIRILREQWVAASENLEKAFTLMLHRAFTGDLTAKWRVAHMKELLNEMEQQAKSLKSRMES